MGEYIYILEAINDLQKSVSTMEGKLNMHLGQTIDREKRIRILESYKNWLNGAILVISSCGFYLWHEVNKLGGH